MLRMLVATVLAGTAALAAYLLDSPRILLVIPLLQFWYGHAYVARPWSSPRMSSWPRSAMS